MNIKINDLIRDLQSENQIFIKNEKDFDKHVKGQNPKICVLTCSDSRVIPEFIFNKSIGEIFVIRVAGNVAIDPSVLTSIEYAVDHLNIPLLIILGHTNCGAVKAAEECSEECGILLNEIKKSFSISDDHIFSNLKRQVELLPSRSKIVSDAIRKNKLVFKAAIYNLKDGKVEFLDFK